MHVNNMREICKFIDVGKLLDVSHVHIIRTKPADICSKSTMKTLEQCMNISC